MDGTKRIKGLKDHLWKRWISEEPLLEHSRNALYACRGDQGMPLLDTSKDNSAK